MKQTRLLLTTIAALLCSLTASAHDFKVDGIYYKISSSEDFTVSVTYQGDYYYSYDNEYSGAITIPSTVTRNGTTYSVASIDEYAFYDCIGLTYINIPNGVTNIGYRAFSGCSSLISFTISESVTSIGDFAFWDCSSLYSFTVPESVKRIGREAFYGTAWYASQPDGVVYINQMLYRYKGTMPENTSVVVKEGTVSICSCAFSGCSGLTSITIPESVKSIGESAFSGTAWYDNQPDGVVYCQQIFYCYKGEMPENTSIRIKEGTVSIPDRAFYDCRNLIAITIPDGTLSVGDYAFYNCRKLSTVSIGDSVEYIGDFAFYYCDSLSSVIIGANVRSIGKNAFEYCESLHSVSIPDSVVSIGEYVFKNCPNLTSVYLGNSLVSISSNAFYYCSKLKSVTIGNSVRTIGKLAFCSCKNLESIIVPNSVTEIGERAFSGCSSLLSVVLGNSVTHIDDDAFYSCSSLASVTFPESIKRIGNSAFNGCSNLETVIFGKSLPVIESVAFNKCTSLTDVYSKSTIICSMGVGAFPTPVSGKATLHVPKSRLDAYKNANVWKTFSNIIPLPILTYMVDGVEYEKEDMIEGEPIITPEIPTKEGYTFSGWSEAPETMPAEDVTISGTFSVNKYLVTFKIGDEVIAADSLEYGAAIVAPEAPEKDGYTFNGWGEVAETVPANDVTYEGSYFVNSYLLTYTVDGETVQSDSVAYGTAITLFDEPTKEGYTFSGWSEVPETMPAEDVTISGTFTINKYLVTFKIGDEVIAADSLEYGAAIIVPEAPYKEGHTFNGWGEVAETVPANDLTYEGTYTANIYKVYYYVGEELVHTIEVAYGEAIPEYIYEPTGEGDVFEGWIGETYETMPAHDVSYTANITNGIACSTLNSQPSTIYDLSGRKIEVDDLRELREGIYIINGKKVVIK